jgi:cyclophilin family peptidyl-prolyl cis-trans isomerase
LVFVLLGSGIAVILTNVDNDRKVEQVLVATSCPAVDKSDAPVLTFERPPPMCINPSSNYTAVFDTTEGEFRVRLDTDLTPNTSNNFIFLTNYGYYDSTLLFRLDPTIAIIQGGSPHTQDWSDPGPGYNIPDEGGVFFPLSNGTVQGPFKYRAGQLVMARTTGLNSSGAQFFLTTGPEVGALDAQGGYIVFGETNDDGLAVLQRIMDLYEADPNSPYGGGPTREVIVRTVTVVES